MRFSAIVLLLSCGTLLQPIQAALPEPARLPTLIIDQDPAVMSIAHECGTTALLFRAISHDDDQQVGCTLTMVRDGDPIPHKISIQNAQELSLLRKARRLPPVWRQIVCIGKKGTCLVAGNRLSDLVFVPAENAEADFPHLTPLVQQAVQIGKNTRTIYSEKDDYFLSFVWTNQAKDRLLLLATPSGDSPSRPKGDVLYYLAKGKAPCAFSDETVRCFCGRDSLSARALFLQDGSCVFLGKDGKHLIFFPADKNYGCSRPLPHQCKGMCRQKGQQIRLLMQEKKGIFAYPLTFTQGEASFGKGEEMADMPEADPLCQLLAIPLGKGFWGYRSRETELILWSEKEGVAAAPLISDMHMWQVADGGHDGYRRIFYCLAANSKQSVIGAIDTPPATLYQESGKLKVAALSFPVCGPGGTAGFFVAEAADVLQGGVKMATSLDIKGTFYSCLSDGSSFSLEKGSAVSIPLRYAAKGAYLRYLPYYPLRENKQLPCWFCPDQEKFQLYVALGTADSASRSLLLYRLKMKGSNRSFGQIKWERGKKPCFERHNCGYGVMQQWVVDEETKEPILVWLALDNLHDTSLLQGVRGLSTQCKYRLEANLPRFSCLGDGNLAGRMAEDGIHIYRLSAQADTLSAAPLFKFAPDPPAPKMSMLLSIQERDIERVLLHTGGQTYCTNFPFKGVGKTCTPHTEKIEDRHFLLPPAFAAHYIGNRAIGHASHTDAKPCIVVDDQKGGLFLVHFRSIHLVVTGYLRRLGLVDLMPDDVLGILVSFSHGILSTWQERTSHRLALFTPTSPFVSPASATRKESRKVVGAEVKCLSSHM